MSWLPQRWRTQRNAIRHANCRIQWIIKPLNASCASGICLGACVTECLSPHSPQGDYLWSTFGRWSLRFDWSLKRDRSCCEVKLSSRRFRCVRLRRGTRLSVLKVYSPSRGGQQSRVPWEGSGGEVSSSILLTGLFKTIIFEPPWRKRTRWI